MKPDRANLTCSLAGKTNFMGNIIAHLVPHMPQSLIMRGNYTVSWDDSDA
jgi:hypothetical protein